MSNVLESIINDLREREKKGLLTYGTTVDREDYSLLDWLQESYHEKLDDVMYMKATIRLLKKLGVDYNVLTKEVYSRDE